MKLNHECVRAMMLDFEESVPLDDFLHKEAIVALPSYEKYGHDTFWYAYEKLIEAEYLNASITPGGEDGLDYPYLASVSSITWQGHEFLDTVRDNQIWKSTKSIISKFSSVSISMIETVATGVLTNLIEKQMGQG